MDLTILTVTTTVGTSEEARRLARALVEARLAACVQMEGPLRSVYRWEGKVCEEAEHRLVIKSLPACEPALRELFAREHPYEVPQWLAALEQGSEAYARGVGEAVSPP